MTKDVSADQKPKPKDMNVKLCRAVEKHRCIYDRSSSHKKDVVNKAWEAIAAECNSSVSFCKVRWSNIRTGFIRSQQTPTSKKRQPNRTCDNYLHDALKFYIPYMNAEANKGTKADSELETSQKSPNLLRKTHDDDEGTTSADETAVGDAPSGSKSKVNTFFIKEQPSKVGTFIIKKTPEAKKRVAARQGKASEVIEIDVTSPEKSTECVDEEVQKVGADTRQLRFQRACKRNLYKTVDQQPKDVEPKRSRRCIVARRATLANLEANGWGGPRTSPKPKSKSSHVTTQKEAAQQPPKIAPAQKLPTVKAKPLEQMLAVAPRDGRTLVDTQLNSSIQFNSASNSSGNRVVPMQQQQVVTKWSTPPVMPDKIGKDLTPKLVPFPMTLVPAYTCDRAVQHDGGAPSSPCDSEFLNSLGPQMTAMTAHQKLHFKQKVYKSLIEVFENESALPSPRQLHGGALDANITDAEMNLMRELVALVQAAKVSPEFMNSNEQRQAEASEAPPANRDTPTVSNNCMGSGRRIVPYRVPTSIQQQVTGNPEAPSQYFRKVVKVTGNVATPEVDKRRVYRIFPKGAQLNVPFVPSPSVGNFIIPSAPGPTVSSANSASIGTESLSIGNSTIKANMYRQIIPPCGGSILVRTPDPIDISAAAPPKLRPLVTVRSAVERPSNNIATRQIVRRYSVCGSENMDIGASDHNSSKIITTSVNTPTSMSSKINAKNMTNCRVVRAVPTISPFRQAPMPQAMMAQSLGARTIPTSLNQFLSSTPNIATLPCTTTICVPPHSTDAMKGFASLYSRASSSSFPTSTTAPIATVVSSFPSTTMTRGKKDDPEKSPKVIDAKKTSIAENFDPLNIKNEPMF